MIQNIIINGLINGSIYALLAIGFSLIFGVARIVNIAHTAFYMLAAYFIYVGFGYLGLSPYVAMPLAVLAVGLFAVICYKLFIDPIREHEAAVLIATIALAMVIQEALLIGFGGHYLGVPPLIKGYAEIVGVKVTYQHLLALAVALLALFGSWLFLMKTKPGLALRSTAQDREVANLMGINEARVAMLTMGISAMIAAIAGAIVVPLFVLDPHMWMHPLIMMLAIVVLGGLGSMKGSFVGAYIMAFAEVLVVFLVPMGSFLKGSVALSIMILVLLIRPEGLFGIAFEEER
ncbi:MAG: branched-chain amino acid ABC transporter permease [Deltaproteobacteria bacterium]|nr:branched-chain amino acid ABC transporter permease [Deltaproteobacteria bacterium]